MLEIKPQKFKVHSLTGRITPELMRKSWKAVKRNQGAAGVDRVTIQKYSENLEDNLSDLMKRLKTRGTYTCPPLKRVHIPKGNTGKTRPLGIPTVDARCAQEVVRHLIASVFEKKFHNNSYGFRPGRNCHQAVECVLQYIKEGYKVVVDVDIKGFFDNIPHELIMTMLRAEIADGNILDIIETFLGSGVVEEGVLMPTTKGTPQGGVISPLLANIVLNYLDWQIDAAGYKFARYADDFVVLCKTKDQAKNALTFVQAILKDLGLECSPEKTKIATYDEGFTFLGFEISSRAVTIRQKSREKFEEKLKEITTRSHNLDAKVIEKLNQVIRGTVNYFHTRFSNVKVYFEDIDKWLRTRLRSMKFKTKSKKHNLRFKNKHIIKRGLVGCLAVCQHLIISWYSS
ncbi:MAG TPA: group II intron reverse transcriptase/maturase [Candidatus Babeliaceae bacterium]|nr:group II intron reverse transcriptase/maturase [Candidatus Babeliaceae bacterium]